MSSPINPALSVVASAPRTATAALAAAPISTPDLLAAMLRVSPKISDLFFSPGKPPLVEINGKLIPAGAARALTPEDTPAAEGWAGHIVSHRFKGSLG